MWSQFSLIIDCFSVFDVNENGRKVGSQSEFIGYFVHFTCVLRVSIVSNPASCDVRGQSLSLGSCFFPVCCVKVL